MMRSWIVLVGVGCAPVEGTWEGSVEVDVYQKAVVHDVRLTLVEGVSQTGERTLEGYGEVLEEGRLHEVEVSGPWQGRRVDVALELEDAFVVGDSEVSLAMAFGFVGRVRGRHLDGRFLVEHYNQPWEAPIDLERVK